MVVTKYGLNLVWQFKKVHGGHVEINGEREGGILVVHLFRFGWGEEIKFWEGSWYVNVSPKDEFSHALTLNKHGAIKSYYEQGKIDSFIHVREDINL